MTKLGAIWLVVWCIGVVGWGMNIYKFAQADFEPNYKTEIIRAVGIPVFFIGGIAGYMDIGEENNNQQEK